MSLQRSCRECIVDVVLRRANDAEGQGEGGGGPLQLIVDNRTLRVLNSFLKMGELHAEGVTSMELIERSREPLPELDVLYFLYPDDTVVDRVLDDFKDAGTPQHRNVHLVFSHPLPSALMAKLAEAKTLAPRIKSFMEVPLSFNLIQDRGFHLDMLDCLPGLFPEAELGLVQEAAKKLADACRCMGVATPCIRYAQSGACKAIAEQMQAQLSAHKGSESKVPSQVLIVDRSVDMAAALVHEYTYEAAMYDLLDQDGGGILDIDRNIVTLKGAAIKESLLSDADSVWEELKHMHVENARQTLQAKVQALANDVSKDNRGMSTEQMLDMLRKTPEQKDAMERLMLHMGLLEQVMARIKEEELSPGPVGLLEQDIACGIDMSGKDTKGDKLQKKLSDVFSDPAVHLTGESKLRLLMLYFSCFANIAEPVRRQLMDLAQLSAEDQDVLMAMLRTKLMEVPNHQRHKLGSGCVHRVTREQAVRFKQNARAEDAIVLSRFEPRVKGLLEQLSHNQLSSEDFPALEGSNMNVGNTAAGAAPQSGGGDQWSFASWPQAQSGGGSGNAGQCQEVTQRIVIFILGGITHSELRAAAEVKQCLPRGTEVLLGGTAILTPRKLMQALRPRGGDSTRAATADDLC